MRVLLLVPLVAAALPSVIYGAAWKKEGTAEYVERALEEGYRALDSANQKVHYEEALVGKGIKNSGIPRSELFLQSKFTAIKGHQKEEPPFDKDASPAEQIAQSLASTLLKLNTDYLDSYILHGPERNADRKPMVNETLPFWKALEDAYNKGTVKNIGISNVNEIFLRDMIGNVTIKPHIVQNRMRVDSAWDEEVRKVCTEHSINYQGFAVVSSGKPLFKKKEFREWKDARNLLTGVNVTGPQLAHAWLAKNGISLLTGSKSDIHRVQNLKAVELTDEDADKMYGFVQQIAAELEEKKKQKKEKGKGKGKKDKGKGKGKKDKKGKGKGKKDKGKGKPNNFKGKNGGKPGSKGKGKGKNENLSLDKHGKGKDPRRIRDNAILKKLKNVKGNVLKGKGKDL